MAAVNFKVVAQCVDGNNIPYSVGQWGHCGSGLLADMETFVTGWLGVLDGVTQDEIQKVDLIIEQAFSGLKAAPVAGSNNEVGALMKWAAPSADEPFSYWYPNWIPAGYLSTAPNVVDQGQTAVLALITFLKATTATCIATNEDGVGLISVLRATKSSRKQRLAMGRVRTVSP